MSSAKQIELIVESQPENTILEAGFLYKRELGNVSEVSYYKTLERMSKQGKIVHLARGLYYRPKNTRFGIVPISESDIIRYYTENGKGIVLGYKLYNRKGLTTQIGKKTEILSNSLREQSRNIGNIHISNCSVELNSMSVPFVETMEILQNYRTIEDVNPCALAEYMVFFSSCYSDEAAEYVLSRRKYKKSTIAFLKSFLDYHNTPNTLNRYLSTLSNYSIPEMREFYESPSSQGRF